MLEENNKRQTFNIKSCQQFYLITCFIIQFKYLINFSISLKAFSLIRKQQQQNIEMLFSFEILNPSRTKTLSLKSTAEWEEKLSSSPR